MTESVRADDRGVSSSSGDRSPSASLRIAVLDRDSGFIQVLSKRLDRLGWEHRVLASPVPTDAVVSMRLSALVVDLAVLGPQAWSWLERLRAALPAPGLLACPGPPHRAPRLRWTARARPAIWSRRRHPHAVPPGGSHRASADIVWAPSAHHGANGGQARRRGR